MVKYILKWNKDYQKANGTLVSMYAMQNPYLVTEMPEKSAQFSSKEEAANFASNNGLSHFSIIAWNKRNWWNR